MLQNISLFVNVILQCRRAVEIRKRLRMMLDNGIPTCIDILLFPACTHGTQEAQSLDGAASSVQENCILLERWMIQCIHKWFVTSLNLSRWHIHFV